MQSASQREEKAIKECENILDSLDRGTKLVVFKSLPKEEIWLLAVERWGSATNGFEPNEGLLAKAVAHLPSICPAAAEKSKSYLERIAADKKQKLLVFQAALVEKAAKGKTANSGGNGAKNKNERAPISAPFPNQSQEKQKRFQPTPTIVPYRSWKN